MAESTLSPGEDWSALRRRFAGEALVRVLAFCGHPVQCCSREGTGDGLFHTENGHQITLRVGPVALLWQGKPLVGEPPDWPRNVSAGAARFFLTAHPLSAAAALDFGLAARRDDSNPYYFTCYIRKRMHSILLRPSEAFAVPGELSGAGRALALMAGRFPAAVRRAAGSRDPFPVNRYAVELAETARQYLGTREENRPLLAAAEVALGNALDLLGVRHWGAVPPPAFL